MFTVIFEDGFQFNASIDTAARTIDNATITGNCIRGPLSIIKCESPWTSSDGYSGVERFMVTCTSVDVMNELLTMWARQF